MFRVSLGHSVFRVRLDGLYLQGVVDTSISLGRRAQQWDPGNYSGDSLDCQRVRELFRQYPEDCRVDLTDTHDGKIYILYTVASDSHDPFSTFQYSMWGQWLVIHNQPVQCRTWASRPFLLKITTDGQKPSNIKARLKFFSMWKHKLASEGIALGPRKLFVTDEQGMRKQQHFDNITVKGFIISYGGDCPDLTAVMNTMNHANPNCRQTKFDISAVRLSSHQLAYSAVHGLHQKEFRVLTGAESILLVNQVEDAAGTSKAAYKAASRSCGAKGHNLFYEGFKGAPYGPVPADPTATIPQFFRQGGSHKLRIHAQNCIELALGKWKSREFFEAMNAEHSIRTMWRGGVKFYSFIGLSSSGWTTVWSRFRINPAIDYVKNFLLLDFDLPTIVSDKVARSFFVSMYKFYHLLTTPDWTAVHEKIAQELIIIHLVSKELLFGLKNAPVSSLDLLAAPNARRKFGDATANSELVDDIIFKSCNTHASKHQMGNVDNSARFRDCYLGMLGLGQAYDFDREEKLQQRTLTKFSSVNPNIAMALPVGFRCCTAVEAHEYYSGAFAPLNWHDQANQAARMFDWDSEEEAGWVVAQLQAQGPGELQYFEQLELDSLPAGRHFNTERLCGRYRNQALRQSSSVGRCGSSIAVAQQGKPIVPATVVALACALVFKLDGRLAALPLLLLDTYRKAGAASFGLNILASSSSDRRILLGISLGVVP